MDTLFLSATEIAAQIKTGALSASDVVEAHIQRIEQVNPCLNAVVFPMFDQARQEAKAADAAQHRGEMLGPLHGVPITIKEALLVKGTPTTFGLPNQHMHRAEKDGPLVSRLRQAGAIILGKTNVSQLTIYIESDNPLYGRTNNPWDLKRSPGGSSGGEAAIIAAGGSALGLGADFGGSIREPAHFCGIHGFKPTSGRLTMQDTRYDLFAVGQEGILAQCGPMARTVADLALAMNVLAAPGLDGIDAAIPPVIWRDPANVTVKGLRVAFYTDDGYFPAAPALRRAVQEAAEALRSRGAQVEEWSPPNVAEAVQLFFGLATADGGVLYKRALRQDKIAPQIADLIRIGSLPRALRNTIASLMQLGGQSRLPAVLRSIGNRSALEYWELVEARTNYRQKFLQAMDAGQYDVILCPPTSLPAVLHGSTANLPDFDSYARLYNLLGMPAGVVAATRVRAGEESERVPSRDLVENAARAVETGSIGLPIGVQVVGRHWRGDVVLSVMAALEEHFIVLADYPSRPPLEGYLSSNQGNQS